MYTIMGFVVGLVDMILLFSLVQFEFLLNYGHYFVYVSYEYYNENLMSGGRQ